MSDLDSLIKVIPFDQVASKLGVDRSTAEQAVAAALPTIIAGLQHSASTDAGADALAKAVSAKDPSVLDGLDLNSIDLADGAKILSHIFGGESEAATSAVAAHISGTDVLGSVLGQVLSGGGAHGSGNVWGNVLGQVLSGAGRQQAQAPTPAPAPSSADPNIGSELAKKLLPMLAPIVLAWLAQQATQKGGQVSSANGGLLQEILGGLLTGAGQGARQQSTGSVVTDVLGQILRGR